MKAFILLFLVAISSPVFARALPKDDLIDAGDSFIDPNTAAHKEAPAKTTYTTVTTKSPAKKAHATLSASATVATKKACKGKHESAIASSPVTTSTAKSKGLEGHHKHHAGYNSTLSGSNSTITALNSTATALNSTLVSSNSTLTASNVTGATVSTSATCTTKNTTISNSHATGKKHKGKEDKNDNIKPTSRPSTNILDNIIGKLTGRDPVNIARDLPSRHTEDEAIPAV